MCKRYLLYFLLILTLYSFSGCVKGAITEGGTTEEPESTRFEEIVTSDSLTNDSLTGKHKGKGNWVKSYIVVNGKAVTIKYDQEQLRETIFHPERVIKRNLDEAYSSLEDTLYNNVNLDSLDFEGLYNLVDIPPWSTGYRSVYKGIATLYYLCLKSRVIKDPKIFCDSLYMDIGIEYTDKDGKRAAFLFSGKEGSAYVPDPQNRVYIDIGIDKDCNKR